MKYEKVFDYTDPYSGETFPIIKAKIKDIKPSPFQRDISNTLVDSLVRSIEDIGGFLSILVLSSNNGNLYAIDGQHRLKALQNVVDDESEVLGILVPWDLKFIYNFKYNIERGPNIKDKSKQVYKMYTSLLEENENIIEKSMSYAFEKAYYMTAGIILMEEDGRFSPGVYYRLCEKIDWFLEEPLKDAIEERRKRAKKLMKLNEVVNKRYKELGLNNTMLKQLIVTRALQNIYGERARFYDDFYETIDKLIKEIPKVEIYGGHYE